MEMQPLPASHWLTRILLERRIIFDFAAKSAASIEDWFHH
jgi:hypothetical protein